MEGTRTGASAPHVQIPLTPRSAQSMFLLPPDVGSRTFPKEIVSRSGILASQNREAHEPGPHPPQPMQETMTTSERNVHH